MPNNSQTLFLPCATSAAAISAGAPAPSPAAPLGVDRHSAKAAHRPPASTVPSHPQHQVQPNHSQEQLLPAPTNAWLPPPTNPGWASVPPPPIPPYSPNHQGSYHNYPLSGYQPNNTVPRCAPPGHLRHPSAQAAASRLPSYDQGHALNPQPSITSTHSSPASTPPWMTLRDPQAAYANGGDNGRHPSHHQGCVLCKCVQVCVSALVGCRNRDTVKG